MSNHTVLLSLPGSTPNTITDRSSHQCFLPNGIPCDQRGPNDLPKQQFSYAAYSAVGSLQVIFHHLVLTFPKPKADSLSWLLHSFLVLPPPHHHQGLQLKVIARGCGFECYNQSSGSRGITALSFSASQARIWIIFVFSNRWLNRVAERNIYCPFTK